MTPKIEKSVPIGKETIGEKADQLANKYFELYKKFLKDDNKRIRDKAETLAGYDLLIERLVSDFALERLKTMIKKHKEQEKQGGEGVVSDV